MFLALVNLVVTVVAPPATERRRHKLAQLARYRPRLRAFRGHPDRTRVAGEGLPVSSGITNLMYRIVRLVLLVYLRNMPHRAGAVRTSENAQMAKFSLPRHPGPESLACVGHHSGGD
jgi:hypothetical protein